MAKYQEQSDISTASMPSPSIALSGKKTWKIFWSVLKILLITCVKSGIDPIYPDLIKEGFWGPSHEARARKTPAKTAAKTKKIKIPKYSVIGIL